MTADEAMNSAAVTIPTEALVAAAGAIAATFGFGDGTSPGAAWPTGDQITVLAATIAGDDLEGGLLLAVPADVAARLAEQPEQTAGAFRTALDALATRIGRRLELGEFGSTDTVPGQVVEINDGGDATAHFGVVLDSTAVGDPVGAEPPSDAERAGDPGDPVGADPGFDQGVDQGVDPEPDPVSAGGPGPTGPGAASFNPAPLTGNGAVMTPSTGPLSLLHDVEMDVTVELGRTTMPIRDLLSLQPGMVVEIDRAAGAPIDVLVNGRLIACGEVVVIDEEFGIRITEIVSTGAPG